MDATARFICSSCSYRCTSLKVYVLHCKRHSNIPNHRFQCGIPGCRAQFSTYSGFSSHLSRQHCDSRRCVPYKNHSVSLVCPLDFCRQNAADLTSFLTHLKSHLTAGREICCPFKNCGKDFRVLSSFKSHISRAHRNWDIGCINAQYINDENDERDFSVHLPDVQQVHNDVPLLADGASVVKDYSEQEPEQDATNSLLNKVALCLMNLEAKNHVATSTIQSIFQEIRDIHNINTDVVVSNMSRQLSACNISGDIANELLRCLTSNPLGVILKDSGLLRTEHSRKTFYKQTFNFVEPVPMLLDSTGRTRRMYHYIPILDSLCALFKDRGIERVLKPEVLNAEKGRVVDFSDGEIFRQNEFFNANKDCLQIMLYQDSFEAVNPLGAARGKHKLLGVYYSIGNLLPSVRSVVDQLQLVLLCREKDYREFGAACIFMPLIRDLKLLETSGIDLGAYGVRRGTVACILGDNLGSHGIGGFVENFSGPGHFCRFCLATNESMLRGQYLSDCFISRSQEQYDEAVEHLGDSASGMVTGIKAQSIFNSLRYYHVCNPGLPPCIGHDIFEGVVPYDLKLYLAYFVNSKKWFTYAFLNRKISIFAFRGTESRDRPAYVNEQTGKIVGHAVQVWHLLRFLPLLVGLKIQDTSDDVWQLVIGLRRLTELVCAPVISHELVSEMNCVIEDYLDERVRLFPSERLKPKHHFISHYPMLTMQFGPLIRLWTLRFESKHSYFKTCIRAAQNFKNLTYTLSYKHQLLQAMYSAGSAFRHSVTANNIIPFHVELYSGEIQEVLKPFPQFNDSTATWICDSVRIHGVDYKKSSFVITGFDEQNVVCGEILMLLVHGSDDDVYMICQMWNTIHATDVGLLQVADCCKGLICITLHELIDVFPLEAYRIGSARYIALRHAFMLNK